MDKIKVNHIFWEALSELEKKCISDHLLKFGVLGSDQAIIADMETPPPIIVLPQSPATINAMLIDWICYSICHAACDASKCTQRVNDINKCLQVIQTDRESSNCQLPSEKSSK